jgi:Ca2+-binding RTX toxin-like protein
LCRRKCERHQTEKQQSVLLAADSLDTGRYDGTDACRSHTRVTSKRRIEIMAIVGTDGDDTLVGLDGNVNEIFGGTDDALHTTGRNDTLIGGVNSTNTLIVTAKLVDNQGSSEKTIFNGSSAAFGWRGLLMGLETGWGPCGATSFSDTGSF